MFYNVYVWYEVSDNHVNLIPKTALAASPSVGVTDVRMSRARRLAACIFSLCSSTIHANNTVAGREPGGVTTNTPALTMLNQSSGRVVYS